MNLITELLTLREEAASNEAVFHVDTPELRVIEAKTKHAVKFFNDIYFDDENYHTPKYGTKCYFIIREGSTEPYDVIRLNLPSKQFIAKSDKSLTQRELRNLSESFPKLYDILSIEAKKEGVFSLVPFDEVDPSLVEKLFKKSNRYYEFTEAVLEVFGTHQLPPKLQDAFLEHVPHSFSEKDGFANALLTNKELTPLFDAKHLVLMMVANKSSRGSADFVNFMNNPELVSIVRADPSAVKLMIDEMFANKMSSERSEVTEFINNVNELIQTSHKLDYSPYISPALAIEIGIHVGFKALELLSLDLDEQLIAKVIDKAPKRITELKPEHVTNKLKERARLAAMALARKR